jgi:hypothetical protein
MRRMMAYLARGSTKRTVSAGPMPASGEMTMASPAMQLRGTHLDLGTAVALGFGEKTRQRLPEIFGVRHQFLIPQAIATAHP